MVEKGIGNKGITFGRSIGAAAVGEKAHLGMK